MGKRVSSHYELVDVSVTKLRKDEEIRMGQVRHFLYATYVPSEGDPLAGADLDNYVVPVLPDRTAESLDDDDLVRMECDAYYITFTPMGDSALEFEQRESGATSTFGEAIPTIVNAFEKVWQVRHERDMWKDEYSFLTLWQYDSIEYSSYWEPDEWDVNISFVGFVNHFNLAAWANKLYQRSQRKEAKNNEPGSTN
jgi:hypothetical protein